MTDPTVERKAADSSGRHKMRFTDYDGNEHEVELTGVEAKSLALALVAETFEGCPDYCPQNPCVDCDACRD